MSTAFDPDWLLANSPHWREPDLEPADPADRDAWPDQDAQAELADRGAYDEDGTS